MRTRALIALCSLLVGAIPCTLRASTGQERAESAGRTLIGSMAPALKLTTIDGKTIDLGSLYGRKAVYLKFWATWCVPCRQQMPHFESTYEHAGKDLAVIAINAGFNDTIDDVKAYRQTVGLKMPIAIDDGRLADALHLRVTPQHIVIGRDGRILYIGHLVDDKLEAALRSARAEPARSVAVSLVSAAPSLGPALGEAVPTASVRSTEGIDVPLRDPAAARATVIMFLSPWCESYLAESRPQRSAACKAAREQSEQLAREGRARWVGIASGLWASADDLAEYRDKNHISIPLSLDDSGALFRTFGVTNVPTLVVIDASGKVSARIDRVTTHLAAQLEPTMH
jgi:peroxiredoxin